MFVKIKFQMRDNFWLHSRLSVLWSSYFPDMQKENPVMIKFGRYSRYRLGSIKLHKHSGFSMITITAMFKDDNVPTEVVDHTIAHELIHYAHGFSSTKQRLHKHPHQGGIIKKEMQERGIEFLYEAYSLWVKSYKRRITGR